TRADRHPRIDPRRERLPPPRSVRRVRIGRVELLGVNDVVGERHRLEPTLLGADRQLEQVIGVVEGGRDDELQDRSGAASAPRAPIAAMLAHRLALAAALFACTACNEVDRTRWSARFGSDDAQVALGERYAAGDGVERNVDEALVWFEKAAGDGSLRA